VRALGADVISVSLLDGLVGVPDGAAAAVRDFVGKLPEPQAAPRPAMTAPVRWHAIALPAGVPAIAIHGWGAEQELAAVEAMRTAAGSLAVPRDARTLVLGDEELMYLPQLLARGLGGQVRTSTTTRTPAVAIDRPGYPLRTALSFASTQDGRRPVFAYNVAGSAHAEPGNAPGFDHIVLVTDAPRGRRTSGLVGALSVCARTGVHVVSLCAGGRGY
jgi:hypothetical protein